MTPLARLWLLAATPTLLFCASFAPQLGSRPPEPILNVRLAAAPTGNGTPTAAPDPDTRDVREHPDDSKGNVDLYGNDVTDAVAQYKFDRAGALYELHSPRTEVPRLPSPKS